MPTPQDIHNALTNITNEASFIQELLVDTLGWPMPEVDSLDDIAFEWTEDELKANGLSQKLLDGKIKQLQPLTDHQPWGVFLLEFKHDNVFTQSRGMTGPLRKVLRGLVPKRTRDASKPAWKREHLLFICTHKFQHYRFAYFKAPKDGAKTAPLAIFGWSPEEPVRTVCQFNLPQLQWPARPQDTEAWVSQWTAAFDVEKVTKEFFRDYRSAFEEVEGKLKGIRDKDQRRLYTQRLFNRLLFIHFIQKKGWLRYNGSANYLQELFNAATAAKEDFLNDRLYWLFFCGFNQIKTERSAEDAALLRDRCGEVPYLNGGLFAMADETDEQGKVRVPNDSFHPLLEIFAHYNFTVSESTPWDIEVAVDPEMLGKVFEELVTGRHESGSYYTPRPIVSFMCKEALKLYLKLNLEVPDNSLTALFYNQDTSGLTLNEARKIVKALNAMKAVDPACGSGAYLLGVLHELLELYRLLYSEKLINDWQSMYELKLQVITNNLYGVDLDEFAVNIARLRLWLSLAVDSESPMPLPNLDYKIEAGDSLLGPAPPAYSSAIASSGQEGIHAEFVQEYRKLRATYLDGVLSRFYRSHAAGLSCLMCCHAASHRLDLM